MSATLPTLTALHEPSATELAQITDALARITNIQVMSAIGPIGLTGSTSAAYVDVTGTSASWTKTGDASGSDVLVLLQLDSFTTVANSNQSYGIKIGSTDYDVMKGRLNVANAHMCWTGFRKITGVAAGSYSPIVRAKLTNATGTVEITSDGTVSFLIGELPK